MREREREREMFLFGMVFFGGAVPVEHLRGLGIVGLGVILG